MKEITEFRPSLPSNEEILAKRLAIAIEALEKIGVIDPAIYDGMTAMNFKIIASNALEEIEEVK